MKTNVYFGIIISLMFWLFGSVSSFAGEKVVLSASKGFTIISAISQLNGYETQENDGKGNKVVVRHFYELGDNVRIALAEDMQKLQALIEIAQSAAKTAYPDDETKAKEKLVKLADTPQEVELVLIDFADLKLNVNPISVSVISALLPLRKSR